MELEILTLAIKCDHHISDRTVGVEKIGGTQNFNPRFDLEDHLEI